MSGDNVSLFEPCAARGVGSIRAVGIEGRKIIVSMVPEVAGRASKMRGVRRVGAAKVMRAGMPPHTYVVACFDRESCLVVRERGNTCLGPQLALVPPEGAAT